MRITLVLIFYLLANYQLSAQSQGLTELAAKAEALYRDADDAKKVQPVIDIYTKIIAMDTLRQIKGTYCARGKAYIMTEQYKEAIADLQMCEQDLKQWYEVDASKNLIARLQMVTGNCEPYINLLNRDMPSKKRNSSENLDKAQAYAFCGQLDKALNSYNNHVSAMEADWSDVPGFTPSAYLSRARFKMNYLHDYTGAIADFNKSIALSRNEDKAFYGLGVAQFMSGDKKGAYENWINAIHWGYTKGDEYRQLVREEPFKAFNLKERNFKGGPLVHFDTLINKYPDVPELYLARAMVYQNGMKGTPDMDLYALSWKDLKKAEELGLKDYRLHLYKAYYLYTIKDFAGEMVELKKGIALKEDYPKFYLYRYYARIELNQATWNDKQDTDMVAFTKYKERWPWERW